MFLWRNLKASDLVTALGKCQPAPARHAAAETQADSLPKGRPLPPTPPDVSSSGTS